MCNAASTNYLRTCGAGASVNDMQASAAIEALQLLVLPLSRTLSTEVHSIPVWPAAPALGQNHCSRTQTGQAQRHSPGGTRN